jgi:hypothetical protein
MRFLAVAAGLLVATPAAAEVVSAGPNGLQVRHSVNLVIPQQRAYAAFSEIQNWWSKQHTYSGDASRLSLQMRTGGCFCERLDDGGGVEHMRVVLLKPGEQVIMTGSLGPLLYEATTGVMDVKVERIAGGSRITMDYRAAGFATGRGAELAPIVDKVLGEQMKRLRIYAASGAPKP